ncbi:STE/STE20/FRAY protein kinase [Puccinia sorghi]|uniref:STE/STE20/FRAY protein kinase n=1 Tax=Puccinia sorghi TaxID=27349 RepID=A0A0L6UEE5_9BASI|nr:STE/STE20/FRAY protein kinase [Puccinia sorghi]
MNFCQSNKLKLTKTLSTTSQASTISASSSKLSESSATTARKYPPKSRLLARLSTTCQTIAHLSSSLTDSLHLNTVNKRTNINSSGSTTSTSSPADGKQTDYNHLSSHRKKILGSVTDQWPMYSNDPQDYMLGSAIGFGASSVVRLTHFKPRPGELCAVKVIDIDRLSIKQIEYLRRETLLMSLAKHPNVLRVRGEWIQGSSLCIAMRLMQAGSIADLLRFKFQDGLSEPVIATVLIQAIAGLEYLHSNGWIHRDIKAANLLLDHDGTVLLADFGISVDRSSDPLSPVAGLPPSKRPLIARQTSFVGTALFMAPEVVTRQLYNDRSDIWSFGITALEMAVGQAPYATISPARVLMKTVQEPSPTLDRRRAGSPHEYSKAFKRFVDRCLSKDPGLRPTAKQLLFKEKFFRQAWPKSFLVHSILHQLPPLELRQERHFFARNHRISNPLDSPILSHLPSSPDTPSSCCTPWDFSSSSDLSSPALPALASPIHSHNNVKSNPLFPPLNSDSPPNVFQIVDSFNHHPPS